MKIYTPPKSIIYPIQYFKGMDDLLTARPFFAVMDEFVIEHPYGHTTYKVISAWEDGSFFAIKNDRRKRLDYNIHERPQNIFDDYANNEIMLFHRSPVPMIIKGSNIDNQHILLDLSETSVGYWNQVVRETEEIILHWMVDKHVKYENREYFIRRFVGLDRLSITNALIVAKLPIALDFRRKLRKISKHMVYRLFQTNTVRYRLYKGGDIGIPRIKR